MEERDFKKELDDWGKFVKDDIKREIIRKKAVRTGKLLRSIDYKINNDLRIDFTMVEYGKFVDEGTRYITARKFFKEVIKKNVKELDDDLLKLLSKSLIEDIKNELTK